MLCCHRLSGVGRYAAEVSFGSASGRRRLCSLPLTAVVSTWGITRLGYPITARRRTLVGRECIHGVGLTELRSGQPTTKTISCRNLTRRQIFRAGFGSRDDSYRESRGPGMAARSRHNDQAGDDVKITTRRSNRHSRGIAARRMRRKRYKTACARHQYRDTAHSDDYRRAVADHGHFGEHADFDADSGSAVGDAVHGAASTLGGRATCRSGNDPRQRVLQVM